MFCLHSRTNQHSCGSANNHCEVILQYMCASTVRDGATTTTIPDNLMQCENYDCNTDTQYGMHENYDYYLKCKMRERNQGLFTADQVYNILFHFPFWPSPLSYSPPIQLPPTLLPSVTLNMEWHA